MISEDIAGYTGKVIRDVRQAKNLTLMELAQKVRISYQQLQKYENGSNRITVDRLHDIASFLETDITEFLPSYAVKRTRVDPSIMKTSHALASIQDIELKNIMFKLIAKIAA